MNFWHFLFLVAGFFVAKEAWGIVKRPGRG